MKSFIPWVGGKRLLSKKIVSMFPDDVDRYVEVFGGGGSVLLCNEKHADLEVYNDINSDLVNLFRCAKYHRAELQREISGYFNSREIFNEIAERLNVEYLDRICEYLDCNITDLIEYIPNNQKKTGKFLIKENHGNLKK